MAHQDKDSASSKLNLFRFAQKRKNSSPQAKLSAQRMDRAMSTGAGDPLATSSATSAATPSDDAERPNIDATEPDDAYPPESLLSSEEELQMISPMDAQSESSLIFERSVEDPITVYQPTVCPRCGKKNSGAGLKCNHQSIVNLPSHYSVENFVSPCLDATTKILTDENADLENVDMVYSRRPSSVMGLNMALGRTRSAVAEMPSATSPTELAKTHSLASMRDLDVSSPSNGRSPTLSFYSYADMINSEQPNPRRPSISQSLSSSFLNSRSNSVSKAGNAITPQRNPLNARPSFSSPFVQSGRLLKPARTNSTTSRSSGVPILNDNQPQHQKKKFSLNMESPNSSDSESDYVHTRKSSLSSRKSSSYHDRTILNRSTSNQSSLLGSPMTPSRRYSNLDEAFYDGSDAESLVVSSIGETLRRNNGEIKSRNNSIIA